MEANYIIRLIIEYCKNPKDRQNIESEVKDSFKDKHITFDDNILYKIKRGVIKYYNEPDQCFNVNVIFHTIIRSMYPCMEAFDIHDKFHEIQVVI